MDETQNRNWWARNWKWLVPLLCIGTLALFAAFIILILSLVFGMMKSSYAYEHAMHVAETNSTVVRALGTPVEAGLFVTGNIHLNNDSGHAELAIPLSGPDGAAVLYVVADKTAGQWTFNSLIVSVKKTGERIDLLKQ